MDLDTGLEQAEDDAARVDLLLGELLACGDRLVPATEHEQRIHPLGKPRPLAGPVADFERRLRDAGVSAIEVTPLQPAPAQAAG